MASMWDRSGYFYSLLPMTTRNGVPVQVRGAAGHFSRLCSAAVLVVSSTSHIKMFWQDHEKFPEVWRGHAAHEPPLTSRVKCQRQHQQWSSAGGRQDVIWTSAHLEPHCHCCHNRMKQEENVYLSLSLLLFYRTVSNWAWLYIVNVNAIVGCESSPISH